MPRVAPFCAMWTLGTLWTLLTLWTLGILWMFATFCQPRATATAKIDLLQRGTGAENAATNQSLRDCGQEIWNFAKQSQQVLCLQCTLTEVPPRTGWRCSKKP